MGLKVLIAEKSKSEIFEQYAQIQIDESYKEKRHKSLVDLAESMSMILRENAYETRILYGIDNLTSQDFSSVDCVIVHPLIRQTRKIKELKQSNPQIGLIIFAADDTERHFQDAIQDTNGVYILFKPVGIEQLSSAVENSVRSAHQSPKGEIR